MSEKLKNNKQDRKQKHTTKLDYRLFERDEEELSKFSEYKQLMSLTREFGYRV